MFLLETSTKHIHEFSNTGLRTLCLAYKVLKEGEEFDKWRKAYREAQTSFVNRQQLIYDAAEKIENNLILLGNHFPIISIQEHNKSILSIEICNFHYLNKTMKVFRFFQLVLRKAGISLEFCS